MQCCYVWASANHDAPPVPPRTPLQPPVPPYTPCTSCISSHPSAPPCTPLHPPHIAASFSCRQPTERGEYRLQSEDGSLAVPESEAAGASAAFSNGGAGELPVGRVLSLGRAALHSMQPDTADNDELTQLITPLVLGEQHLHNHLLCWCTARLLGWTRETCHYPVRQGARD